MTASGPGPRTAAPPLLALALLCACRDRPAAPAPAPERDGGGAVVVEARRELMGTEFRVSVAGLEPERARPAVEAALAEIARVERLLSHHVESSDVSRVNAAAGGEPVPVSEETIALLEEARRVSELSGGAFDVTFAALSPVWRSVRESPPRLPSDEAIARALGLVGFARVAVDREARTVRLPEAGMAIGLGGIGKGHGVDQAGRLLEARGVADYIVGGGGDLRVSGSKGGVPWRLGIQHPRRPGTLLGEVVLDRPGAVVTSGDYERFVVVDGVRHGHILDPRTGRPARGAASVTLLAPNATLADGLATAVFVLGPEAGMRLVESLEEVEAVIVDASMGVAVSPGLRGRVTLRDAR